MAVFFLARLLGGMYFINNIDNDAIETRCRRQLVSDAVPFLLFFLAYVIRTLLKDGFAVNPETQMIALEPYKYFNNFVDMPYLLVLFLLGVLFVLYGLGKSILSLAFKGGIWYSGIGTILTVLSAACCRI